MRQEAYRLFGVDVTRIPGLDGMALSLFSELGRDLAATFPNSGEFSSWLALCSGNDRTGGRVIWKGVRKIKNRAGQIFRQAASALHRSRSPLGDLLHRMKAKLGPEAGITATAHKIAIIFYTLVTKQIEYDDSAWAETDRQRHNDSNKSSNAKLAASDTNLCLFHRQHECSLEDNGLPTMELCGVLGRTGV